MCTKSTIPHADWGRVPQRFRRVLINIYGFKSQSDRCGYLFGKKIASQTVRSDFFTATTDAPLYKYDTFGIFIIVSDRLQGFYIGLRQIPVILFLTIELIVVICRKKAFMSFRWASRLDPYRYIRTIPPRGMNGLCSSFTRSRSCYTWLYIGINSPRRNGSRTKQGTQNQAI